MKYSDASSIKLIIGLSQDVIDLTGLGKSVCVLQNLSLISLIGVVPISHFVLSQSLQQPPPMDLSAREKTPAMPSFTAADHICQAKSPESKCKCLTRPSEWDSQTSD